MSKENKLNWLAVLMLILLISMIIYLIIVNGTGGAENGLECVYNCDNYQEMLEGLK